MKDNVINFPKRDPEDEQQTELQHLMDRYDTELIEHQKEIKLEYCVKEPIATGLKASLKKVKKEMLEWMVITDDGQNKGMNKPELIDQAYDNILSKGHLLLLISLMTEREYKFFCQLLEIDRLKSNELFIRDTRFLLESGLVFSYYSDDSFVYIIAKEVKEAIRKVDLEMLSDLRIEYQQITRFLEATVNLYGAILLEKVIEIFNEFQDYNQAKPFRNLEDIIDILLVRDQRFDLVHEVLVSDYFYDEQDAEVQLLLETILTKDQSYYLPPYEIYMKYSDDFYVEKNAAYRALEKFVGIKWTQDPIDRLDLMGAMKYEAEFGSAKDTLDLLSTEEYFFSNRKELEHFMQLYIEFCNHTRMWVNHGHTPKELSDLISGRVHTATSIPKISRNTLCPCGSGKKYKHCCGK